MFPTLGVVFVVFFWLIDHFVQQTVETLIRCSIVQHLIWVCAICQKNTQCVSQKSKVKRELIKAQITWNHTSYTMHGFWRGKMSSKLFMWCLTQRWFSNAYMHKIWHLLWFRKKSPFTKVMYKKQSMDPLHDNLSDPNQTSKMLVVIQIQTFRHKYGIEWYFKSRLASVLKKKWYTRKNKSIFYFQLEVLEWPQLRQKIQIFHSSTLTKWLNLLIVLIDTILMTNLLSGMEQGPLTVVMGITVYSCL